MPEYGIKKAKKYRQGIILVKLLSKALFKIIGLSIFHSLSKNQ